MIDGFRDLAPAQERGAEVALRGGEAGFGLDGAGEERDRFGAIVAPGGDDASEMKGAGVVGIGGQDPLQYGLGFGHPARAHMGVGRIEFGPGAHLLL